MILNPDMAWLPDVMLLNSAERMADGRGAAARLVVSDNGNVSWLNPMLFYEFV